MTSRRDFDISRLEAIAHGFSARSARSSFFLDSPALTKDAETGNQRPGLDDLTEQVASLGGSISIYKRGQFEFRKVVVRANDAGNITLGYRYARNNKSDLPHHATPVGERTRE